jgi:uncharacterized protein (TIGR02118 family)
MICVSVLYPNTPGKKFDHSYYAQKHMPLVRSRLKSFGLLRDEIDQGLSAPGAQAPFVAIARMYFNTLAEFQAGMKAHEAELLGDVPNYTELQPQIQVSEMV